MSDLVKIVNGKILVSFNSVPEAKSVIKQLKLKKKEYNFRKKEINQQQQKLRAEYTDWVRKQASKPRGRRGISGLMSTVQTANHDAQRKALAEALEPLEKEKQEIESAANEVEQNILQVESYILEKT